MSSRNILLNLSNFESLQRQFKVYISEWKSYRKKLSTEIELSNDFSSPADDTVGFWGNFPSMDLLKKEKSQDCIVGWNFSPEKYENVQKSLLQAYWILNESKANQEIPVQYNDFGVELSNWENYKELVSFYLNHYRETQDANFLFLADIILEDRSDRLIDCHHRINRIVHNLHRELLDLFHAIKATIIKMLIWNHLKRLNINSEDDDSLNENQFVELIFIFTKILYRIYYESIRKRNYYRKAELCYLFKT